MKNFYTLIVFVLLLLADVAFGQTMIKRASLSTSVSGGHNIQKGQYKVQQSIAHMGIMSTVKHDNHAVTRGFLLPQGGGSIKSSIESTIPDFDWVVYPNPFQTYVNIDFDAPVSGDMVIRLHDIVGQLIIEKAVTAYKMERLHRFNG